MWWRLSKKPQEENKKDNEEDALEKALLDLELDAPSAAFIRAYADRLRFYDRKAKKYLAWYQGLRIPALIAAAIVPALVAANPGSTGRIVATALSVFVAAATGVEVFIGAGRKWRHYRGACESLRIEGWMFVALAGDYGRPDGAMPVSHRAAFPRFAQRGADAFSHEVEEYVASVATEPVPRTPRADPDAPGSSDT